MIMTRIFTGSAKPKPKTSVHFLSIHECANLANETDSVAYSQVSSFIGDRRRYDVPLFANCYVKYVIRKTIVIEKTMERPR